MRDVVLARRAERDLRRIGQGDALVRLREALESLAAGQANLDIKSLVGAAPWYRLRVGDYRVLYRAVAADETSDGGERFLVARVIHRRDLERAAASLG